MFTHYKDMKGDKKFGWLGGGGLGITRRHRQHIPIRYSICDFLFNFNGNYASVLYRFRVIARYLLKVANFNPPHLHLTPFEFSRYLWHQKTRVPELSCGIIYVIIRLAILIQYWSVADTHTDKQTHDDGIYRTSIASHSRNRIGLLLR